MGIVAKPIFFRKQLPLGIGTYKREFHTKIKAENLY